MKTNILSSIFVAMACLGAVSCSQDNPENNTSHDNGKLKINFNFSLPSSRATETAFENGDKVGVFVNEASKPIEIAGNTVNNAQAVFDGSTWSFYRDMYWDEGNYNAVAYYPYQKTVSSITDFPFSVDTDQSRPAADGNLSGYEASDFLCAHATNLVASDNPVNLTFSHVMSKVSVRLIKGEDFEGELPTNAEVYIHSTVTSATVDLNVGITTKNYKGGAETIKAASVGNYTYSAIVVPQRLENRQPLVEVIINGVSYLYESKFVFKQGVHHLINLVIDTNPEQMPFELRGDIVNWN